MAGMKSWAVAAAMVSALMLPQIAKADDDLAVAAIKNHDWATAEQQLQAGLQKDPANGFLQLNLGMGLFPDRTQDRGCRSVSRHPETRSGPAGVTSGESREIVSPPRREGARAPQPKLASYQQHVERLGALA